MNASLTDPLHNPLHPSLHPSLLPKLAEDIRLGEDISSLYAHINAATLSFLEKLRDFDQRGAYGIFGCKSSAHWLNWPSILAGLV